MSSRGCLCAPALKAQSQAWALPSAPQSPHASGESLGPSQQPVPGGDLGTWGGAADLEGGTVLSEAQDECRGGSVMPLGTSCCQSGWGAWDSIPPLLPDGWGTG